MRIRKMVEADGPWAAALMAERRREYEAYSPTFWRRSRKPDIVELHGSILGAVIAGPESVAVRCDDGFAIATPHHDGYYVDDFAVGAGQWTPAGSALLLAIWETIGQRATYLRVVTAQRDRPKVDMLRNLGLTVAERWWVKPLVHNSESPRELIVEEGAGFRIERPWVPPVYDPGGPVGVVTGFASAEALAAAERSTEGTDLALLIAPLTPGSVGEAQVEDAGFAVASEFYLGIPVAP